MNLIKKRLKKINKTKLAVFVIIVGIVCLLGELIFPLILAVGLTYVFFINHF